MDLPFALQADQLFNFTAEEVESILALPNGNDIRAKLVPQWYRKPSNSHGEKGTGDMGPSGATTTSAASFSGPQLKMRQNSKLASETS